MVPVAWVASPQVVEINVPDFHRLWGGTALSSSFSLPHPNHAYRVDWSTSFSLIDNGASLVINGRQIFAFDPYCHPPRTYSCSFQSKSGSANVEGIMKKSNTYQVNLADDGYSNDGYLLGMKITLKFYYR